MELILGRAGSGKTAMLYEKIKKLKSTGGGGILIVPEQFSHEAEREMCARCGNDISLYAEVLSFSRLSSRVFSQTGGLADKTLDKGGRVLLMNLALKTAAPILKMYDLGTRRPEFLTHLIATMDEFSAAGADYGALISAAENSGDILGDKLRDLAAIFDTYNSLIPDGMIDPYRRLDMLRDKLLQSDIGSGHVFIDGFTDFTGQELKVLERLLEKCADMTVCLTCDDILGTETQFEVSRQTAAQLMNMANRCGKKAELIYANADTDKCDEIRFIERNLFASKGEKFEGGAENISLFVGDSITRECELAASRAAQLVRKTGCRMRDIVVAAASWERYRPVAAGIFKKYAIPIYTYGKEDITQNPVLALISSALDIVNGGWEYGDMFRYLKTDMTGIDGDLRDILENYVYKWNIRGERMWSREEDWTAAPSGYSEGMSETDAERLKKINELRRAVSAPLKRLADGLKCGGTVTEKVRAVYAFTEDIDLYGRIEERKARLEAAGDNQKADEYKQIWDIFITALEQFDSVIGTQEVETEEFIKLYKLLLAQYEVATIPASLDSVSAGDITRMRRRNISHMIILGTSDDKMPSFSAGDGVLTDSERDMLFDMGIELSDTSHLRLARQMYTIYTAVTQAHKTLCMSYSDEGGSARASFIFSGIGDILNIRPRRIDDSVKYQSPDSCFELAAAGDSAAIEYFESRDDWRERLKGVLAASKFERGKLSEAAARGLYSQDINITASRVDKFKSCKFSYFLRYGLRAKPKTRASFEAPEAGTFIHYILENVTRDIIDSGGFSKVGGDETERLAVKHTKDYVNLYLDGFRDKTRRFIYLFERLARDAAQITAAMAEELSLSDFKPLDFELDFSRGGDLPPAVVYGDGGRVTVNGKVDRVDGWVHDGKLYVKVVDYKTGRKEFSLADVLNGIGLQMLIYLFVLQKKGKIRYDMDIVPAGVLYMPARQVILSMDRGATDSEIEKERAKKLVRRGILLDDGDVIEALEHGKAPKFIPVKFSKDGEITGDSVITAERFGALSRHVDRVLLDMAKELRTGEIDADPYFKGTVDNACSYCDYFEVCRFGEDKSDRRRFISRLKKAEIWDMIEKNDTKGGGGGE